jgi:hypothetical protein
MPKNMKRSQKYNDSDSSSESDDDEAEVVLNHKEYQLLLKELFPSNYMNNKVKETPKKK